MQTQTIKVIRTPEVGKKVFRRGTGEAGRVCDVDVTGPTAMGGAPWVEVVWRDGWSWIPLSEITL